VTEVDPAAVETDTVVLDVGGPAAGGSFISRAPDGRVVFVRHALPGERVGAVVTARTTSFLRADAVEVLTASPDRVEPPCRYAGPGACGGCDWQHVAMPAQRRLKSDLVAEQLRRLAGVDLQPEVEPVPGAPDGLGWRTRVRFAVAPSGRVGLHRHRSRQVQPVDRCLVATPEAEQVGVELRSWPGVAAVEVAAQGSQAVVAVTPSSRRPVLPDVDAGVVLRGRPVAVPHGLCHQVLGRRFEVAAGGFWQAHVGGAEALAGAVLEGLQPQPGDRAADLYAGAGLFAALVGERVGPTGAVVAVEAEARACADAARNCADLPQVRVRTAHVDAAQVGRLGQLDLVVLDPPRAGAGVATTRALSWLRPRRLAYVACDPASFARDLRVLLDAGWQVASLRAFDLFPMTEHVELVAVLTPPGR